MYRKRNKTLLGPPVQGYCFVESVRPTKNHLSNLFPSWHHRKFAKRYRQWNICKRRRLSDQDLAWNSFWSEHVRSFLAVYSCWEKKGFQFHPQVVKVGVFESQTTGRRIRLKRKPIYRGIWTQTFRGGASDSRFIWQGIYGGPILAPPRKGTFLGRWFWSSLGFWTEKNWQAYTSMRSRLQQSLHMPSFWQ